MKLIDKYFTPYDEFNFWTTLSEEELKIAFSKEFPAEMDIFSKKNWQSLFDNKVKFRRDLRNPLILSPIIHSRNSARGKLFIQCEKAENSDETVLHITITPTEGRLLIYIIFIFLLCWITGAICAKFYFGIIPGVLMFAFTFLILACCREAAINEIPQIRQNFEWTIWELEEKYHNEVK